MKVELTHITPRAGETIANIASLSHGNDAARNPKKLLHLLKDLGHDSTFEHITMTFKIEGMIRASFDQLRTHRLASFTARSQRHCDESTSEFVVPNSIKAHDVARDMYLKFLSKSVDFYGFLLRVGIPKEDARYILPMGITTETYVTMNLRELMHIKNLRTAEQAQWEVREVVTEMVKLVCESAPELAFLFEDDKEE